MRLSGSIPKQRHARRPRPRDGAAAARARVAAAGLTIRESTFAVIAFTAGLLAGAFALPPRYEPVENVSVLWVREGEPYVVLQFGLEPVELSPERAEQLAEALLKHSSRVQRFRDFVRGGEGAVEGQKDSASPE